MKEYKCCNITGRIFHKYPVAGGNSCTDLIIEEQVCDRLNDMSSKIKDARVYLRGAYSRNSDFHNQVVDEVLEILERKL